MLPTVLANLCSLALAFATVAEAPVRGETHIRGETHFTGSHWRTLQGKDPQEARLVWAQQRVLKLEIQDDGVVVHGRWTLHARGEVWFNALVLGPDARIERATLNGVRAPIWSGAAGTMLTALIRKRAVLDVVAFVPSRGVSRTLTALPATLGSIEITSASEFRVTDPTGVPVLRSGKRFISGAAILQLAEHKKKSDADKGTLAIAQTGIGITLDDGELRGRAKVKWTLRRGEIEQLRLTVRDVGEDLEVEGPQVLSWERNADVLRIQLTGTVDSQTSVELKWSRSLSKAVESGQTLPTITPQDVFRSESTLQLARAGEVDALPELSDWAPISARQLPKWGQGLVDGAPTAAFRRAGAARGTDVLKLLRFEPVPGPPLVVEVADFAIAATSSGDTLVRARFEVLNERAASLKLTPPAGAQWIGAWVASRPVTPGKTKHGIWVPLPRSLETVRGLVSVPVVVAFVTRGSAWARRERADFLLPQISAPISVTRVSMYLPREYESKLKPGQHDVVARFTRGRGVAFGIEDDRQAALAEGTYAEAERAWQDNDFRRAQQKLDQLELQGADGKKRRQLQSNLDLVAPRAPKPVASEASFDRADRDLGYGKSRATPAKAPSSTPAPAAQKASAINRRIRARASARATGKRKNQFKTKQRARRLRKAGKLDEAKAEYKSARKEAQELQQLENAESTEYEFEQDEITGELEDLELELQVAESLKSSASEANFLVLAKLQRTPPPSFVLTPLAFPRAGVPVRYQLLLTAPNAPRHVQIDARRKRRRHRP